MAKRHIIADLLTTNECRIPTSSEDTGNEKALEENHIMISPWDLNVDFSDELYLIIRNGNLSSHTIKHLKKIELSLNSGLSSPPEYHDIPVELLQPYHIPNLMNASSSRIFEINMKYTISLVLTCINKNGTVKYLFKEDPQLRIIQGGAS